MPLPINIIANADDFGLNQNVNIAIALCFQQEIINSASLLTNTQGFDSAVKLIKDNKYIQNIGLHVNLAGGMPLTNLTDKYLDANGNIDLDRTGRSINLLGKNEQAAFKAEIEAQISKAMDNGVLLTHIDSHHHLHTLPAFFFIFREVARKHRLKLRLAQTYREGSYIKYAYRKLINNQVIKAGLAYSERFETVQRFLQNGVGKATVEVMLHPDMDSADGLTDHYDAPGMQQWLSYIKSGTTNL